MTETGAILEVTEVEEATRDPTVSQLTLEMTMNLEADLSEEEDMEEDHESGTEMVEDQTEEVEVEEEEDLFLETDTTRTEVKEAEMEVVKVAAESQGITTDAKTTEGKITGELRERREVATVVKES